jgi:hypothetical protein
MTRRHLLGGLLAALAAPCRRLFGAAPAPPGPGPAPAPALPPAAPERGQVTTYTYYYDVEGRLTSSGVGEGLVTTVVYDGQGRRDTL